MKLLLLPDETSSVGQEGNIRPPAEIIALTHTFLFRGKNRELQTVGHEFWYTDHV